jgi:hemoglobin
MKDLENREDLILLMDKFYQKLLQNKAISYLFTDIAQINMEHHLPVIVDFWNLSLFGKGNYKNNVLKLHLDLNEKSKLTAEHFKIWLDTFYRIVDENFSGKNSEKIKTKALSIATVMQIKLHKSA